MVSVAIHNHLLKWDWLLLLGGIGIRWSPPDALIRPLRFVVSHLDWISILPHNLITATIRMTAVKCVISVVDFYCLFLRLERNTGLCPLYHQEDIRWAFW